MPRVASLVNTIRLVPSFREGRGFCRRHDPFEVHVAFAKIGMSFYVQTNMRCQISTETWEQIKTAFASGLGLRELARNMGVSENTVLARARREKWTHQILIAKQQGKRLHSNALAPMQSAAITMQERGERYTERMAGVQRRFCRISNQCSLARSSTARETSNNSIASPGATLGSIRSRPEAPRSTWLF